MSRVFDKFIVREQKESDALDFSIKKEESSMSKASKISMRNANTVKETFERFLVVKKAAGIADKTLVS